MYRIQVNINELYLRLGSLNKKDQKDEIYLEFECKQKNTWTRLNERVKFQDHLQKIDVEHIIYVKKQEIVEKKLIYRILLITQSGIKRKKMIRHGGECVIQVKDYDVKNKNSPFGVKQGFQLFKCPDKQAYLKFTIIFEQLMDFELISSKNSLKKAFGNDTQEKVTENDILLQQQKQILSEIMKQVQKFESRNQRLTDHTKHLKDENQQLVKQLKQKQHSIKIDQQLKQDKLDMLIKRKLKAEQEYKKVKEKIGNVFNVINEYGRPDLIEEISSLLTGQKQDIN